MKRVIRKSTRSPALAAAKRKTKTSSTRSSPAGARSTRKPQHLWDDEDDFEDERNTPMPSTVRSVSYKRAAPSEVVSFRLDAEMLAGVDKVAKAFGWSRTGTIKRLMASPLGLLLECMQVHESKGKG